MPEDDFLIPRRSYSSAPEAETSLWPEAVQGVRIDQSVLEERRRRKGPWCNIPRLSITIGIREAHSDRRIGNAFPAFEEPLWTLGDTARWIAERTREAVDGLSIDEERLFELVSKFNERLPPARSESGPTRQRSCPRANCQMKPGRFTSSLSRSATVYSGSFPFTRVGHQMMHRSFLIFASAGRMFCVDGLTTRESTFSRGGNGRRGVPLSLMADEFNENRTS